MSESDAVVMHPVVRPIVGSAQPPGSKSLTNRALIIAALAEGRSMLHGVLHSRDTAVMIDSLRKLGLEVREDQARHVIELTGCGGVIPNSQADLWLENSGTSIRFLTALCALGNGRYRLDGNDRMRERPIGDLVRALNQLGANCHCESPGLQNSEPQPESNRNDCPPVLVDANGLRGGQTLLDAHLSSQFLSALLMAAPGTREPVEIQLSGPAVSEPYIDMTLGVMARFGVTVDTSTPGRFVVQPQKYRGGDYHIEPDASAASYFFAAAAITGGRVTVTGLSKFALQGDVGFADALEQMGCQVEWESHSITVQGGPLRGIEIDMNAISDTAQTLSAVAVFAEGSTTIRNVAHMRHKETDRVSAVVTELRRLGQWVDEHPDGLTIHPRPITPALIETYDDHRMAMSFALIGLRAEGIRIANPGCTAKTYPNFFQDLEALCGPSR